MLLVGSIAASFVDRLGAPTLLVFLGLGMEAVNALTVPGSALPGVENALTFIEILRQAKAKAALKVPRNVVVIGGGNTAIDAAVQAKRLGAQSVTLVYRRGEVEMSATRWEQDLARVRLQIDSFQPLRSIGIGRNARQRLG